MRIKSIMPVALAGILSVAVFGAGAAETTKDHYPEQNYQQEKAGLDELQSSINKIPFGTIGNMFKKTDTAANAFIAELSRGGISTDQTLAFSQNERAKLFQNALGKHNPKSIQELSAAISSVVHRAMYLGIVDAAIYSVNGKLPEAEISNPDPEIQRYMRKFNKEIEMLDATKKEIAKRSFANRFQDNMDATAEKYAEQADTMFGGIPKLFEAGKPLKPETVREILLKASVDAYDVAFLHTAGLYGIALKI